MEQETLPPEVSIYLGSDQMITFEANGDIRYLGQFVENRPSFYIELMGIMEDFKMATQEEKT